MHTHAALTPIQIIAMGFFLFIRYLFQHIKFTFLLDLSIVVFFSFIYFRVFVCSKRFRLLFFLSRFLFDPNVTFIPNENENCGSMRKLVSVHCMWVCDCGAFAHTIASRVFPNIIRIWCAPVF